MVQTSVIFFLFIRIAYVCGNLSMDKSLANM